jgi:23S rRNA pseudouridine2604 synthase
MTNDGDLANRISKSVNKHEKEYIVKVNKKIDNEFIINMSNGVKILDTVTRKCKVNKIDDYTFNIILTQGLNRQIRRMCNALGFKVIDLKRIRVMNIKLGNLQEGSYRNVSDSEISQLISNS